MKVPNFAWFFAVLVVLAALAVGINWAYNVRIQLRPEALAAAKARWAEHGPADYDLEIEKLFCAADAGNAATRDAIAVRVRGGKAVAGTLNGRPLPERVVSEYAMPGWFGFVEGFLERDIAAGTRSFRSADFDATTGALQRFRRRVSRTNERQEIVIRVVVPK